MIGYQAQVIPAMMAGFTLVYLEKFFRKVSPEAISMIIVPFFSLVPAVIVAHTVVGPIGWVIGNFISDVVYGGLTSNFGWLFATLFGFVYAPVADISPTVIQPATRYTNPQNKELDMVFSFHQHLCRMNSKFFIISKSRNTSWLIVTIGMLKALMLTTF